jgi:hypothetical protein
MFTVIWSAFQESQGKDWLFFGLAFLTDLAFFFYFLPRVIEHAEKRRTAPVRARALRSVYQAYLEAAATLDVEPGTLTVPVLRARVLEAIQDCRARFSHVVSALLPVLDAEAQLKVAEVNACFTDALNLLEVKAWRPLVGDDPAAVWGAGLSVPLEAALRALGDHAQGQGAVDPTTRVRDGRSREAQVLLHFHAAGLAIDELRARARARAGAPRRARNARLFPDVPD